MRQVERIDLVEKARYQLFIGQKTLPAGLGKITTDQPAGTEATHAAKRHRVREKPHHALLERCKVATQDVDRPGTVTREFQKVVESLNVQHADTLDRGSGRFEDVINGRAADAKEVNHA